MVPKYFPMKAMVELVWVLAMNNIVYVGKRRASMIANSLAWSMDPKVVFEVQICHKDIILRNLEILKLRLLSLAGRW